MTFNPYSVELARAWQTEEVNSELAHRPGAPRYVLTLASRLLRIGTPYVVQQGDTRGRLTSTPYGVVDEYNLSRCLGSAYYAATISLMRSIQNAAESPNVG